MAANARIYDPERTDATAEAEGPKSLSLTIRGLDTREGKSRWVDTLWSTFCEMDVSWPLSRNGFDAAISVQPVGTLAVTHVRADPHTVVRSPAMIASDSDSDVFICMITKGSVQVEQSGRSAVLERGAFALLDSTIPFAHVPGSEFEQVVVRAPRDAFASRMSERVLSDITARGISAGGGVGAAGVISRLLLDIATTKAPLSQMTGSVFASSVVDMLVATIGDVIVPTNRAEVAHARDLIRVRQVLEHHLSDPDYSLSDVATEVGMSVRYIHNLFSETGATPRAWLYRQRLDRARVYLESTPLTVAEISIRVGFRDVSHFSRAFRTRFGVSPGRYRGADQEPSHR
ncbi:helix-turn-helix domain-containing protein [Rhodococcus pyridinivorans]|uniref:helix-turn-helix domain-containing protein n=1 Tax=Rhodococcus pyridinivorans TaxID=103816 RepID=UPI0034451F8E